MELIAQVRQTVDDHHLLLAQDTVVLGVSGGPDSLCLLDVMRQLAPDYAVRLHVAHLNHGLRGEASDQDAAYVASLAQDWGLPYTIERADVAAQAQERRLSIEEAARQTRYRFLAAVARQVGGRSVAVAHHADDQVETVLMHFLRGSGLGGLRGMRPLSRVDELRLGDEPQPTASVSGIRLLRPLLNVTRREIEEYCIAHDLHPRFDLSNLDQTYFRNRVRHELIPLLETYNPNFRHAARRMAEVVAADFELLRQQAAEAWPAVVRSETAQAIVYDLTALRQLPLGLQRSLLREGIHRLRFSLRDIDWQHVEDALRVIRSARVGARAVLPRGLALTLGYDEATLAAEGYEPPLTEERPRLMDGALSVPVPGTLPLPDTAWQLTTRVVERDALAERWRNNPDPYTAYLDFAAIQAPLALRARQEGDWFQPLGLQRRQLLSDFMINVKVPRRERDTLPLLVAGGDIVWVVGWRIDSRYAITPQTRRVLVVQMEKYIP
ncbi:MAG: tRNA lysidine(34) synthetase TilS [Chloroflexi bacterium]|nr:tRNA lysidine(34) synthetase TilS [Chloroflexota bacterium]